ncbi:MAG: uroporphyrinogen III decarboxylase [Clostridiales bacterium]|nr:uroporphyrinogen III decarboxylase [Clostridiales bacterium]MDO4351346.1 uroporphyrinogen decarboxylase family protein [Eubacteriales bacterium]MDY4007592.1 uroporphyrinogen decarboxylase family protein [Candidatus Limiplasma sp.]
MNRRERVLAAIGGRQVDHVPSLFSLHFPREQAVGGAAVEAHVRFYNETGVDVLKIMNEHLEPAIGPVRAPEDWRAVKGYHMDAPFLRAQADIISNILEKVEKPVYSLATIHGVCASCIHPIEGAYGYARAREILLETLRSRPDIMLDVHKRVTDTMCELAQACIRAGADGIYYAALGGERHYYTDEEHDRFLKPFDLQIMQAAREAGGQVFLHICKENLNMMRYREYAPYADVVNWGVYEADFSLSQGRALFPGCAILGGLKNRGGVLARGDADAIAREVRAVLEEAGTTRFLLGADCTLPTDTPYASIAAAARAAVIEKNKE